MSVPFQDFKAAYHELKAELDDAYFRFMESGWYVLGKELTAFEEEYAHYCEAEHCVGVANGLDALHLALRALNIGPGDEVIVPSNTYIATWLAVTQAGAIPVAVEPDPATFNLDATRVEDAVTARTKVIFSVNLYGQPCDYDPLLAIASKHGLKLAIDNAQAQGSHYKGRRAGGIADIEFLVDYWVLAHSAEFPALVEFPDNIRQLETLERVGLVPAERCRHMKAAYLALRQRVHQLALDEGRRVVPGSEYAEVRQFVTGVWAEVFAGVEGE